jgi:hypothetical protein
MVRPFVQPGSQNVPVGQLTGNEIVQIVRGSAQETQTTTAAIAALAVPGSTLVVQDSDDDVVTAVTQITFVGATVSGGPTTDATVTITGGEGGLPTGLAPVVGEIADQVLTTDPSDDALLNVIPTSGNAGNAYLELDSYGAVGEGYGQGGQIVFSGARGVAETPAATLQFDSLAQELIYGYDGDDYFLGASMRVEAASNFTGSSHVVNMQWYTVGDDDPSGGAQPRMVITGDGGLQVGLPSGTADPGDVNIAGAFKVNGVPISSGGNTITLTADTNIAAGTAVSVNAAGHAAQTFAAAPSIANTVTLFAAPTNFILDTTQTPGILALSASQFVAFQAVNQVGSTNLVSQGAVAFTVSGSVITAGSPSTSGGLSSVQTAAALSASSFICAYLDGSNNLQLQAGTIAANAITVGSAVEASAGGILSAAINRAGFAVLSATAFVFTYQDSSNQNWYVVGTVSGTTITLGTPSNTGLPSAAATGLFPLTVSSTEVVLVWADPTSSDVVTAAVGSISGTTLTLHTPATVLSSGNGEMAPYAVLLDGTHFCVTWGDSSAISGVVAAYAAIGAISGTSITFGTQKVVVPNWPYSPIFVAQFSSTSLAFWGGPITPTLATVSGTTLTPTLGSALQLPGASLIVGGNLTFPQGGNSNISSMMWPALTSVSSTQFLWEDGYWNVYEESNAGVISPPIKHLGIITYAFAPINSTSALALLVDFAGSYLARVINVQPINSPPVGCSASAVTSGNPATITLSGACSGFSGLTPGTEYYANGDGTLTTANTGYSIGVALTSSQLLVL